MTDADNQQERSAFGGNPQKPNAKLCRAEKIEFSLHSDMQ